MSFIQPIPCDDGGGGGSSCCPVLFTGYCLADSTPIAITFVNGIQTTWTNLLTGVVTPGPPPAGTGICSSDIEVEIQPLTCEKDSITICPGDDPIIVTAIDFDTRNLDSATDSVTVTGTVELGAATIGALQNPTVDQGTSPWVVSATDLDIRNLTAGSDSVTVFQGTTPWVVSGTVDLSATTLAALETITVVQGTSPWVVSGTIALDAPTLAALENITVQQGTSPWVVSGTITPAESVVSTLNSSSTPLAANGAFIGTYESTLPFVEAAVMVTSDTESATDGLRLELSTDGVSFNDVDVYTISAGSSKQYTLALNARFFRVTYTNGPTPQTTFNLSTLYRRTGAKASSHRINDTIVSQDDAELVKAVISGQMSGGSFINIGATNLGSLFVRDEADHPEDAPSIDGDTGLGILGVRNDIGAPKTSNDGDYTFFATDAAGRIGITDLGGTISVVSGVEHAESTVHTDGDVGNFMLAVRNDAHSALANNGEYIPFTTDSLGGVWVSPTAVIASALSTNTPLGSSASFTSPWIAVERYATVRISALTDQAGTLFTEHSDDNGVTILRSSAQPVEANRGEFLSFHPRSSFFRVVYTNGSVAQTLFHLETILHTVAIAPTESLVSAALARTSLALQTRAMLYDYKFDETARIIPSTGDLTVVQREALLSDPFIGPVQDTTLWENTLTGSGSVSQASEVLELETGVVADSTVEVKTTRVGRFVAGSLMQGRIGVELVDAGVVNNVRRWGFYDDDNGYFFELNGTTLNAVGRSGGVDTAVPASSWSEITTFVLDPSGSIHSYEIAFFATLAYFLVDGEVHHIMQVGGKKGHFPIRFENNNSGGSTTDVPLIIRGAVYWRYGPNVVTPTMKYLSGAGTTVLKIGTGRLHRVSILDGSGVNTAILYDNTSGSGEIIAEINVDKLQGTVEFGADFNVGLTVVLTGADTKVSVVYS